jgi:hypothetical protein
MKNEIDEKWNTLKTFLAVEALTVLGEPVLKKELAYEDLREVSSMGIQWWQGIMEVDGRSRKRIESAIRFFIRMGSWPAMPNTIRCAVSLRLRLAGRIARGLRRSRSQLQKDFFLLGIRSLPHKHLLRWLLLDAWDLFAAQIFDESVEWASEVRHVLYPTHPLVPGLDAQTN